MESNLLEFENLFREFEPVRTSQTEQVRLIEIGSKKLGLLHVAIAG